MAVPTSISELSTTPGSNPPSGSDSPTVTDDHFRTAYSFIKTLSDNKAESSDVVALSGEQTIAGVKTFSDGIVGNVTGNVSGSAGSVSGTVGISSGGTGQTTAAKAFTALKQAATQTETGVVELATSLEAEGGTDTSRVITPATLRSGLGASGSAPVYACRAWVNFNGSGSLAVKGGANISSVTDNGTGDYTVNFTTAMPTTGYAVVFGCETVGTSGDVPSMAVRNGSAKTTTSVRVLASYAFSGTSLFDPTDASVAVFC